MLVAGRTASITLSSSPNAVFSFVGAMSHYNRCNMALTRLIFLVSPSVFKFANSCDLIPFFLVEKRSSSARGFNFTIFVNHSDKRMISISTSLINFKVQYHQLAFWFLLQILCYMSFYHNHVQVSDFELVFHRWSNK